MTTLTLTVLRCPDDGSVEQRRVRGGELTVGRGADCGWRLSDASQELSREHFKLEFRSGAWQIRDLSSNGTFINSATAAVGRNMAQPVFDGDRLRLGSYEIELRIEDEAPAPTSTALPVFEQARSGDRPVPGFADTPLPGLDNPQALSSPSYPNGALQDHASSSSDAFVAKPVVAVSKQISDDWEFETPLSRVRPPAVPLDLPTEAAEPGAPADTGSGMAAAFAAFLAGGKVSPGMVALAAADSEAALRQAGALLRAAVAGIRALLIARSTVKGAFRIEQTMLMRGDNSPLKFSASDEQALISLLDPLKNGLLAIEEAVTDLTSHQEATLAATQAAARALLQRLDPHSLQAEDAGTGLFFNSPEKRLWHAYKRRHAQVADEFEDNFQSAFGTAFARAYEQAVERVNAEPRIAVVTKTVQPLGPS